jgi:hypothetical protein
MLELTGFYFRRLSFAFLLVGLLSAFYTEAFADIPIGRGGRPKPPLSKQRLSYLCVLGAGVPGICWATARTLRGKQRRLWD